MTARDRAVAALGGSHDAIVVRAPGRVNLIGEHVDYSGGLVCPAAIDRDTVVAARRSDDGAFHITSADLEQTASFTLNGGRSGTWLDYVAGVARALAADGVSIQPARLAVASDVPIGAGLSSSAALEVACAAAFVTLAGTPIERRQLAAAGRRAENDEVGVPTGIMDQLIIALARHDHALLIDCRSETTDDVRIPEETALAIIDSGVRHALAASAYGERRRESERAAELMGVALRDATDADLARIGDPVVLRRARHVVTENARVRIFVHSLRSGNLTAAGAAMRASHVSLRDDYEVSCAELDVIVAAALDVDGVYGARMTGGGFGGSAVALVQPDRAAALDANVRRAFAGAFGRETHGFMVTRASDGVTIF